MSILNLPEYNFKFKEEEEEGKKLIFDEIRKAYVAMTPEEWVRQNFLKYLQHEKKFPQSLISVEKALQVYKLKKRADIVVYNNSAKPILIVECKAPHIKITQDAFDQAARYNIKLRVNYLVITNGIEHYCCKVDLRENNYTFLKEIPEYKDL